MTRCPDCHSSNINGPRPEGDGKRERFACGDCFLTVIVPIGMRHEELNQLIPWRKAGDA